MLTLKYRTHREERIATADRVMLADGSVIVVRRANLAEAKALLAAERAVQRRMDTLRAPKHQRRVHLGASPRKRLSLSSNLLLCLESQRATALHIACVEGIFVASGRRSCARQP